MFRGQYAHNLDPKGRTSIPSKFREILQTKYGEECLIITHFDGCLWGYPNKEWEKFEDRIADLPQFKREVKAIQRMFVSAACECPIDKQGRILIPPTLRSYAELDRDIVIVGMSRRIEIWDQKRWEKEFNKAQENKESIEEVLAEFGI